LIEDTRIRLDQKKGTPGHPMEDTPPKFDIFAAQGARRDLEDERPGREPLPTFLQLSIEVERREFALRSAHFTNRGLRPSPRDIPALLLPGSRLRSWRLRWHRCSAKSA
jgi:hypothetical protein